MPGLIEKLLSGLSPKFTSAVERGLRKIPAVEKKIDSELSTSLADLEGSLKPYRETTETFSTIPAQGRGRKEILRALTDLKTREESRWKEGFASGAVYHGAE